MHLWNVSQFNSDQKVYECVCAHTSGQNEKKKSHTYNSVQSKLMDDGCWFDR